MKRAIALIVGFMILAGCASAGSTKSSEETQAKPVVKANKQRVEGRTFQVQGSEGTP